MTKLVENLPGIVQLNSGADARSDGAVTEHARNLAQSFRRQQGIVARGVVVRCDVVLGEPRLVCREDRRDEDAARLENLSVAADCLRIVDEIEDRVNAVRVRRATGSAAACSSATPSERAQRRPRSLHPW